MSPPFPTVPVTVDAIIEMDHDHIVLIERRDEPFGTALPGGFVEPGESLYQAVRREVKEEVGLDVHVAEQFYAYSKPGRDHRGPVVSVVFICSGTGSVKAGDDAAGAMVVDLEYALRNTRFAFDHEQILRDYVEYRKTGRRPYPSR